MSNYNDTRNETLLKQIEARQQNLKKPVVDLRTNCMLEIGGEKQNLNIMKMEKLVTTKIMVNAWRLSAIEMGMKPDDVKISGFSISDWLHDIDNKMEVAKYREEEAALESMKGKLHKLLSEDKRTSMALDDIESQLKSL